VKKSGNITVEAAIAVPTFILFIMAFVMMFNVLTVHKAMQEAISETANTLASCSYLGYKAKVLEIEQEASQGIDEKAASSKKQVADFLEFYALMQDRDTRISGMDLDSMLGTLEKASNSALEVIQDPKKFGISVAYAVSQFIYEGGKTAVLSPLVNVMVRQYMDNYHGWTKNAVDHMWVEGDMDYMSSKFYGVTPEIELEVHYAVRPLFFDGILPDLKLSNKIIVRCWGPGDSEAVIVKKTAAGWITPNSIRKGHVFHTMKCMSLNSNASSRNVEVQVEQYVSETGQTLYKTVEYKGKVYTLCKNCAIGGEIAK
jgi:hypothetical protein